MKRFTLIAMLVWIGVTSVKAQTPVISEGLQRVIVEYAANNRTQMIELGEDMKRALTLLTEMQVSPCVLKEELYFRQPGTLKKIEYLLRDLVDEQARRVETSERAILQRLSKNEQLGASDRKLVRDLAIKVAANSMSLTELREEVIPGIFVDLDAKLARVHELDVKVDLIELQLHRLDSVCDKVAVLWEERQQRLMGDGDYAVLKQPNLDSIGNSVLTNPTNSLVRPDSPISSGEWTNVTRTAWEPDGYNDSVKLCSNPSPGPARAYFDTNVHENGRWVAIRRYGAMYQNCDGQIIMVVTKTVQRR